MNKVDSMDFEEINNNDANSIDGDDQKRRSIYRMDMLVNKKNVDNKDEETSNAGERIEGRVNKNF